MSLWPAGAPAGRQSNHWLAKRGLQPHAPPPDPGGGRPSYPLARLRRLLLLPAVPLPLLPSSPPLARPALCPWSPARDVGAAGAGAFSALDLDSDRRQVRWGGRGRGSGPLPVRLSLSTILFSDSLFQHCPPPLCTLPSAPVGTAWVPYWGVPPGPRERSSPVPRPLLRHLFAITSPSQFCPLCASGPQPSRSSSLIPNL